MLSKEMTSKIGTILSSAFREGRNALFEFEVYDILEAIGLGVPQHLFVEDLSELAPEAILKIGTPFVLKIVSPDIAHKQKVGGVKVIRDAGLENVQKELLEMKENVLSFFGPGEKPKIEGFLLTEYISFTSSLGYEVLFGFKQDPAFGPVLTVSKGGDDAEFFARYYDPANLVLPPLGFDEALKEVEKLNIRHKFVPGHEELLIHMARVLSGLSSLSLCFSPAAETKQEFVITEMDINPFVWSKDNRFLAVDGFAKFKPENGEGSFLPSARIDNLQQFFLPKGIGVVGVSADMGKFSMGREIARLLHNLKRDDLYFINVKGGSLKFGDKEYKLYKNIDEIKTQLDLVVYAAPAQIALDFAKSLAASVVKAVIFISGIPVDMKYSDFKASLSRALPEGIRVIGPNCMGVFYAPGEAAAGLNTFFIEEKRLEIKSSPRSNTALLTQSGALGLTMIDRLDQGRLMKAIVSFGNKYDVNIIDLIEYFSHADEIEVLALYVEGFDGGEGRAFFEQVGSMTKPVIVYKSGKTEAGARAAASHTASMSGSYEVFKAACRQANAVLAEKIEDYEDYIRIFSMLSHKKPKGVRIAGIFNAGFESTIGADELGGLKQAQLSGETLQKLKKADKYGLVDINSSFLDITPMADDKMYADFIEAVLQDENVDCVFIAIVPYTSTLKTLQENCCDRDSLASLLPDLFRKYDKPIVVSVNGAQKYYDFISILKENGLPVYGDVRSAIKSLDRFAAYCLIDDKAPDF